MRRPRSAREARRAPAVLHLGPTEPGTSGIKEGCLGLRLQVVQFPRPEVRSLKSLPSWSSSRSEGTKACYEIGPEDVGRGLVSRRARIAIESGYGISPRPTSICDRRIEFRKTLYLSIAGRGMLPTFRRTWRSPERQRPGRLLLRRWARRGCEPKQY